MKRGKAIFYGAVFAVGILISGCSAGNTEFEAKVLEIEEQFFLIEPLENEEELLSADQISLPASDLEGLTLEVGDIIKVTYNGEILESYPARLGEVYSVELTEE